MTHWTVEDEQRYCEAADNVMEMARQRGYAMILDSMEHRDSLLSYYMEHGLPRTRMDHPISSIDDYVMYSEIAFECHISMDNTISMKLSENRFRMEAIRKYAEEHPTLFKLGIGCPPFPERVKCYYTIAGSKGECEEVYETGLSKEDEEWLGW